MKYQLPCPACGTKLPVEASQAGQMLVCKCGQQLDVPSIRELRRLEPIVEETVAAPTWNKRKGLAFLGTAIVLIAAGVAAVLLARRPSLEGADKPAVVDSNAIRKEIDSLPPDESYVRFVLIEPWVPTLFAERTKESPPQLPLLPSADLISRFEGAGHQFIASKEAVKAAQTWQAHYVDVAKTVQDRNEINDWLRNVALLGGLGLLIGAAAFFVGSGKAHDRVDRAKPSRPPAGSPR